MPVPESPPRRRPVPPPKTESQAQLRQELTSPSRTHRTSSNQAEYIDGPQNEAPHSEAPKQEGTNHLTLPEGWVMKNAVDVTYHTHVAKPVVHETIHHNTTELVEPRITREIHHYHQYNYIQPLEVEVPNDCYATNAKGEVIHAPGGLTTHVGETSHWEQERQDRGYSLPRPLKSGEHDETDEREVEGRDKTVGPLPIEAEGGGERVLGHIRDGGVARRFGGALTSPYTTSPSNHPRSTAEPQTGRRRNDMEGTSPPEQNHLPDVPQVRTRGGGFEEKSSYQQPHPSYPPQTPPRTVGSYSTYKNFSLPDPTRNASPNLAADLEQNFNRLSLQHQHPEAKALPSLPDTSPRSTHSKSSVRRMSADTKLRDRYSIDSNRRSLDDSNPMIDDETVPERGSSARKTRIY
ncbi:hypothetical protein GJ744_007049 [Endocarpon pusillum]|uniref:Uncharacterized protein n=1 Tax=Endocarpon pusillum TaxID=364733 RepID=A0A8H7AJA9_9EURO|nr:hypothetical protein GJ744_007049 [Endocarpon pusillum]